MAPKSYPKPAPRLLVDFNCFEYFDYFECRRRKVAPKSYPKLAPQPLADFDYFEIL